MRQFTFRRIHRKVLFIDVWVDTNKEDNGLIYRRIKSSDINVLET